MNIGASECAENLNIVNYPPMIEYFENRDITKKKSASTPPAPRLAPPPQPWTDQEAIWSSWPELDLQTHSQIWKWIEILVMSNIPPRRTYCLRLAKRNTYLNVVQIWTLSNTPPCENICKVVKWLVGPPPLFEQYHHCLNITVLVVPVVFIGVIVAVVGLQSILWHAQSGSRTFPGKKIHYYTT